MAVAFSRYVDGTTSAASTTAAVNLSVCAANNLVFVLISRASTTANSAISQPGWTLIQSHSSTYARWIYYKQLQAADITTVTWTFGASSVKTLAHALVYTGARYISSAKGTFGTAAGNTQDCGSITSSETWLAQFCGGYATAARTHTAQATYPERRDNGGTSPDFWHLLADTNNAWAGGASNPTFAYDAAATCTYRGGFQVLLGAGAQLRGVASTASLTASAAVLTKAAIPLTTTSSPAAATTATTPTAWIFKPYGASSVSLTASAAVATVTGGGGVIQLPTTSSPAILTTSTPAALKKHTTLTTTSPAIVTTSTSVALRKRNTLTTSSPVTAVTGTSVLLRKRGVVTAASLSNPTPQPLTVSGSVYEFHAARALLGKGPGLNDPLTTSAYDTSGNTNHGTLTTFAGTTASGYAGTGTLADPHRLVFDGTSDTVVCTDFDMTGASGYTLELYIQKNAAGDWWGNVLNHAGSIAAGPRVYWTLDYAFSIVIAAVDGSSIVQWQPNFALTTGVLTHFILSVDNVSLAATVFVDGVAAAPVALAQAMGMPRAAISSGLVIGGANVPVSIPVARIYPFALTPEQVAQNYEAGYLWPMDPVVSATAGTSVVLRKRSALTTSSPAVLTTSAALATVTATILLTTTSSPVALTTSSPTTLRKRSVLTTSAAASATTGTSVVLRKRSAVTTSSPVTATTGTSVALKKHVTLTTQANASVTTGTSVALRKRSVITTGAAASATTGSSETLRKRIASTTSSPVSLTASSAAATVTPAGYANATTTEATVSLTASTAPTAWIFKPYSSVSASLAASSAVLSKGAILLTTTSSPAALTASTAETRRKRSTVTTSSAVSLTASSAVAQISGEGDIFLTTTFSTASLTTAVTPTRCIFQPYSSVSASLTASAAVLTRFSSVRPTTVASSASLTASAALTDELLYALPVSGLATTSTATLHKGYKYPVTTGSTVSLTTASAKLRRLLKTTASTAALTASAANPFRVLKTTGSTVSLIASSAGMGKTNSPGAKFLTTTASTLRLLAYTAVTQPKHLQAGKPGIAGSSASGTQSSGPLSGICLGGKVTLEIAGEISQVTAQISNTHLSGAGSPPTDGYVRAVVYADDGGVPGALVGFTPGVLVPAYSAVSWVDFPFTDALALSAGDYWIGLNAEDSAFGTMARATISSDSWFFIPMQYTDVPADPAPDYPVYTTRSFSIYATYRGSADLTASRATLGKTPSQTLTYMSTFESTARLTTAAQIVRPLRASVPLVSASTTSSTVGRRRGVTTDASSVNLYSTAPTLASSRYSLTVPATATLTTSSARIWQRRFRRVKAVRGHSVPAVEEQRVLP